MSWSVIQGKAAAVNSGANTAATTLTTAAPAVTTVAGNSLIIIVWGLGLAGALFTVTDSAGNTYLQDLYDLSSGGSVAVYSAHGAASVSHSGGWFRVVESGATSNTNWGVYVIEAAPPAGQPGAFDTAVGGTAGTLTNPSSGVSPQTVQGDELILGLGLFNSTNQNVSLGGGYTAAGSDAFGARGLYPAYRSDNPAAGTYTFNAETDGGIEFNSLAALVAYKVANFTGASRAATPRSGKGTYLANALAGHALGKTAFTMPAAVYLVLCTVLPRPDDTGSTLSEAGYTGYARVQLHAADLAAPVGGLAVTVNTLSFPAATGGSATVVGWALCDASSGGNLLYWAALPQSVSIANGQTPRFFPGEIGVLET